MKIWVDAQLSPFLAGWISAQFSLEAVAVRELGLREALDKEIFMAAKEKSAVIMTKDSDFLELLDKFGSPPQIIWITCGNTSNAHLKEILISALPRAISLLQAGEPLVEISDIRKPANLN